MEINDRNQLKGYFQANKRPKESEFGDLIDSVALVSEIPQPEVKPYKVFSALLRIEDESWEIGNPRYVAGYSLLEPNTIGDLDISLGRRHEFIITDLSGEGKLNFERRFIIVGAPREDFNFDVVMESQDASNDFVILNFIRKGDGISLPDPNIVPLFYNLPIEIRVYNALEVELPFPGGPVSPGGSLPNPKDSNIKS